MQKPCTSRFAAMPAGSPAAIDSEIGILPNRGGKHSGADGIFIVSAVA